MALRRRAGESLGVWPCSAKGVVVSGASGFLKTADQFEFRLARRRDFDGLNSLFARCGVEKAQEGLVRLDAIVGGLVRDLECELQGIACAQDDGVWTVL